jgi:choline dehydrogenase-like flavoprotein
MRLADTFGFVVAGGGSGRSAVAGFLSEDPNTSVALLEAGGVQQLGRRFARRVA